MESWAPLPELVSLAECQVLGIEAFWIAFRYALFDLGGRQIQFSYPKTMWGRFMVRQEGYRF